ncbi:uncharacterized protein LOC120430808 isoform X1 [Culex pipiens pallens]|nr:uncharacterized protein LOC120418825 [Culex pipiens pallens]XP_039437274.1 uncharacterized protein LOC120418825 [Culex pipiens pallens]XP_039451864.1 uncharacterized protein LOC120430808 isoform X1 [Culex pipiens pallens]
MSLTATTEPYLPGSIPFSQYLEQLEWIFLHNKLNKTDYKTSFLAICGQEVYTMLKKLFPGENLKDLSYDTITDKLKKHYDKSDSEVIHSFKFWSRKQGQHEKAEDYVLSVKVLAERCCFGDFRDRAIRDVLVMGVFDRGLQKRLFDEDNLTADKAEKMILNQELSSNRTRILNNGDDGRSSLVNRLGRRPDRTPNKGGYRNRSRSNNRTRSFSSDRNKNKSDSGKPTFFCTFCKKNGHTRKFCYRLTNRSPRKPKQSVKFVDSPKPSSSGNGLFKRLKKDLHSDDDDMACMMISSVNKINEPCYVEPLLENRRMTMEIDCGSAESVISEDLFNRNFRNLVVKPCNKRLVVIDGKRLTVLGKVTVNARLDGVQQQLDLVILRCEMDFIPLMGRTWLDVFYSNWRSAFSRPSLPAQGVHAVENDSVVVDLKNLSWRQSTFGA